MMRAYDAVGVGMAVLDAGGRVLAVNGTLATLLGLPRESIVGKMLQQFLPPRHTHDLTQALSRLARPAARRSATPEEFDAALLRQDGSSLPVALIGTPIDTETGVRQVAIAVIDLSLRHARDRAWQREGALFQRAVLRSPFPMILHAEDGEVLHVNQSWCELTGYTADELPTIEAWTARAYGHRQRQVKAYIDGLYLLDRTLDEGDYAIRTKDGATRTWAFASGPVGLLDDGRRVVVSTASDVTVQRQVEATARLHSSALEAAANAILITDRRGTIVWANRAFSDLTGYGPEEVVGCNPRALLRSGRQDRAFYAEMWATILSGGVWVGELINRRKDGTCYPERQTITPVFDAEGGITHFIAIKEDQTEAKRLLDQFLQAQKMEVVGRLASGVAHDFNNILTLINGTADLLLRDLDADDARRPDLEQIHFAGQRGAALTRHLLAFSRVQPAAPAVLDLRHLLEGMRGMLQSILSANIPLLLQPGDARFGIRLDAVQVEQVVLNLVVNARDAMPEGGSLTIAWRVIVQQAERVHGAVTLPAGRYVVISVADTGSGMDAETRSRIFEPFFTTKAVGKGTGLGLSTVAEIVHTAKGSIEVSSEPGLGTTFEVWLPAFPVSAPAPQTGADPLPARGRETVVIAEDEGALGRLTQRVLQAAGYTVHLAHDGAQALALLDREDVAADLLMTDITMPRMSGQELADRAVAAHPGLRVLYTSGHSHEHFVQEGSLGADSCFLHKPYGIDELQLALRRTLDAPMAVG